MTLVLPFSACVLQTTTVTVTSPLNRSLCKTIYDTDINTEMLVTLHIIEQL